MASVLPYGISPVLLGVVASLVGLVTYGIYQILQIGSRPSKLPPGPPTTPIWGNLTQVDWNFPQNQFTQWSKEYGPVYSIMMGANAAVIVSGQDEAKELFSKKGQHTSGRPVQRFMLSIREGYTPSLMDGSKWRSARKLWHAVLNVGSAKQYLPYQVLEAKQLLFDLMEDEGKSGLDGTWRKYIERYSNSVAMTLVNGRRVLNRKDPEIDETLDDLFELTRLGVRGAFLDHYPFLRRLPDWCFPIIHEAKLSADKHQAVILKWYNSVRAAGANEQGRLPSFNLAVSEKLSKGWEGVTDAEGAEISQTLLDAGTDTTAGSLVNCIGALAINPRVLQKAQAEIDRVVGADRMPEDTDEMQLPYIRQIVLELQRWLTVVPLALPHAASDDVQWGPYLIPKGTRMILNAWAIHTNPEIYPNPEEFLPERWEGKLESVTSDDQLGARTELWSFGAGRRVCPGQHLAERSLFLGVSHLIWAFSIRPRKDASGKEIPIRGDDIRRGPITTLNNFPVDIAPRDPARAALIRKTWATYRSQYLDVNEQWSVNSEAVAKMITKLSK